MTGRSAARGALGVYVLCFSAGALMHARDFAARGWRPYRGAPPLLESYWSALIVLDLAVVVLVLSGRRRAAVALAVEIMTTDVGANTAAAAASGMAFSIRQLWPLLAQTAFLGFVLGSAPFLWPRGAAAAGR